MTDNVSVPWIPIRDFTHEGSRIIVRVTSQDLYRSKYSMKIGRLVVNRETNQEEFRPFFPIYVKAEMGKVSIDSVSQIVSDLIREAQAFIHDRAQTRENEILNERIEKDLKDASRGKLETRQTGKTERNRNKHRQKDAS